MRKFTLADVLIGIAGLLTVISWFMPTIPWQAPMMLLLIALLIAG